MTDSQIPSYRAGFVAVIGRPNVGKSTLVNALVGSKISIVSSRPQTTRHRMLGIASFPEGQLVLVDTPGIHAKQSRAMNRHMNRAARGAVSDDGNWLAYTPNSREDRTWKRYRGGMATDIWLFNLESGAAENLTRSDAADGQPMWHGATLYFLSDRDEHKRAKGRRGLDVLESMRHEHGVDLVTQGVHLRARLRPGNHECAAARGHVAQGDAAVRRQPLQQRLDQGQRRIELALRQRSVRRRELLLIVRTGCG